MRFPCILATIVLGLTAVSVRADPSALWNITNDKCLPHQRIGNDPKPCSLVDLAKGFVVLKDLVGATQFLLMPTVRVTGIESPELLTAEAPNYWDDAWHARHFTEERAGGPLPREIVSLAVNSKYGRTQNQLHIHIDCVRPDVRDALAMHKQEIGTRWTGFPVQLAGMPWRVRRLDGDDLGLVNLFKMLAESDPDAAADMGAHTLVVVGMTYENDHHGFVVLDSKADLMAGNRASGEELQDHGCALKH